MPQICQYYLAGICRFGDRCFNVHSKGNDSKPQFGISSSPGTFGNNSNTFTNNTNTFGKKSTVFNNRTNSTTFPSTQSTQSTQSNFIQVSRETIYDDLVREKPLWKYSSYSPGRGEPNLISGLDISPEELRMMYYELKNNLTYETRVSQLDLKTEQSFRRVLDDLNGAVAYVEQMRSQQPAITNTNTNVNTNVNVNANTNTNVFASNPTVLGNGFTQNQPVATQASFASLSTGSTPFGQPQPSLPIFGQNPQNIPPQQASSFGTTSMGFGSFNTSNSNTGFLNSSSFLNSSPFGQQPIQTQPQIQAQSQISSDNMVESNLPPDILQAFQADRFTLHKIPEVEPPLNMR